ncbi:SGNH/GDSL hydrolase family protein [Nocardia salmonicida]|uniref:SGNH/GDSL hydrolase family protein n=1 Tax=Nocardia salmonicida TaxID=53431 RepID=UPI0033C6A4F9
MNSMMRKLITRRLCRAAVGAAVLALIAVPTAGAQPSPASGARYVALGDSGAATTGVLNIDPTAPLLCARSTANAPALIADALGISYEDRTCSSAKIRDLSGRQSGVVPPQFEALGPDTDIVTLHIGANDADMTKFIGSCHAAAVTGSCAAAADPAWDAAIDAIAPAYTSALDEISRRAPKATIFVDGWPTYFDPGTCSAMVGLRADDAAYIQSKFDRLNAVVSREATAHGAIYIDTRQASTGHGMCSAADTRWFDPVVGGDTMLPYHPTFAGHRGVAALVVATIRSTDAVPR